ncbi:unnamed protein product [Lactuca saligna]|uniref:Uncharacterized protein n=1 Tax=Lactuca saligna TaxID=75948 RepID=A0AA35ZLL0_LACSI|nr:unnamed protein product [Lactuca saligna]
MVELMHLGRSFKLMLFEGYKEDLGLQSYICSIKCSLVGDLLHGSSCCVGWGWLLLFEERGNSGGNGDGFTPNSKAVVAVQAASVAMANGFSVVVTMPLDTIKTRLQVLDCDFFFFF